MDTIKKQEENTLKHCDGMKNAIRTGTERKSTKTIDEMTDLPVNEPPDITEIAWRGNEIEDSRDRSISDWKFWLNVTSKKDAMSRLLSDDKVLFLVKMNLGQLANGRRDPKNMEYLYLRIREMFVLSLALCLCADE